jgi:hypothetical protein
VALAIDPSFAAASYPVAAAEERSKGRVWGIEERFPPSRLSRKETIAGTRRNGRDAPKD